MPLDAAQQEYLLAEAEADKWTVARLRIEVRKRRGVPHQRRSSIVGSTRRAADAFKACTAGLEEAASMKRLTHGSLDDAVAVLRELQQHCRELERRILGSRMEAGRPQLVPSEGR